MKYGKKRVISEVPLINLISREDLDRLMRQKPERGGYGA